MTVLIAVSTFLLFVALDAFVIRRRRGRATAGASVVPVPAVQSTWVAGFDVPRGFHYQRGHVWAREAGGGLVDVGVDDFAARLIGRPTRFTLPTPGTRVQQGARTFGVRCGPGRNAELVSPVTGEVVAVNPRLAGDPAAAAREPYTGGWLCRVRCDDFAIDRTNLLSGDLAERWTEEARDALEAEIDALTQWACRDGGELAPDYASKLDRAAWRVLVGKFLLT